MTASSRPSPRCWIQLYPPFVSGRFREFPKMVSWVLSRRFSRRVRTTALRLGGHGRPGRLDGDGGSLEESCLVRRHHITGGRAPAPCVFAPYLGFPRRLGSQG